jgi:hypothetical protein
MFPSGSLGQCQRLGTFWIKIVVCTFCPSLEMGSWGCRVCQVSSTLGRLVSQPFELPVGGDEQ